jgi:hypothetical protein
MIELLSIVSFCSDVPKALRQSGNTDTIARWRKVDLRSVELLPAISNVLNSAGPLPK